jgi:hypothetical protein
MHRIHQIHCSDSRSCIIAPLLYMAGIFCLSSISGQGNGNGTLNPLGWISPNVQNFLHVPVYGGLAALWLWALGPWIAKPGYRYLCALVLTMGYGWLDEWHQTFVPGRYGSLTDVGFNLMGAVIGMVIYTSWFSGDKRKE